MASSNKTVTGILIVVVIAILIYFVLGTIIGLVKMLFSPVFWIIVILLIAAYLYFFGGFKRKK